MTEEHDRPHNRITADLAAANARLMQLRAERGITPRPAVEAAQLDQGGPAVDWQLQNAIKVQDGRRAELDRSRYGAARASAGLTSSQDGPEAAQATKDGQFPTVSPQSGTQEGFTRANERVAGDPAVEVRVYPDMTALAHKQRKDAQCRVYLFAQSINTTGSGWVELEHLRSSLEGVYTWRRVRQIIAGGEGAFWTRNEGVIYLHRPDRVINALGGGRMTSRPVKVEARHLRAGMHEYRAVFVFGAFLSGRKRRENPISQAAVKDATGAAESTQRTYYRAAGVEARRGIKLIGVATAARLEEAYWNNGRSVFRFVDYLGRHGRPGASYIAQSIGNVYQTTMKRATYGRFGKIQGNLSSSIDPERANERSIRIYYPNGGQAQAWRAYSRHKVDRAYYSGPSITVDAARPPRLGGVAVFIRVGECL